MSYAQARNLLNATRRDTLDACIADWSSADTLYVQAANNLLADQSAAADDFSEYLGRLSDRSADLYSTSPTIASVFEQAGEQYRLQGVEAVPHAGSIFGRAVLIDKVVRGLQATFAENFVDLGVADEPDLIRATLERLIGLSPATAPSRFEVYFEAFRRMRLGRGAVFATFVPFVPSARSPWNLSDTALSVRDSLGLGEDPPGKHYVLFSYRLESGVMPRVPTSASPGWSYQRWFRPSSSAIADGHGWTAPLTAGVAPRAEIVHGEMRGATLIFPLLLARA